MARKPLALCLIALLAVAACGPAEEGPAPSESTAEPIPPGAPVGATGADATVAPDARGDTAAHYGSHP